MTVTTVCWLPFASKPVFGFVQTVDRVELTGGKVARFVGSLAWSLAGFGSPGAPVVICAVLVTLPAGPATLTIMSTLEVAPWFSVVEVRLQVIGDPGLQVHVPGPTEVKLL